MRNYIRHPLGIPIGYSLDELVQDDNDYLKDISAGGLCFCSRAFIEPASVIHISIPLKKPGFEATGIVAWCKKLGDHFESGVYFKDEDTEFSMRMMEQVCHIEEYKNEIALRDHRHLTDEEAAMEWVAQFAKDFPRQY